jgi:hypothetical protein
MRIVRTNNNRQFTLVPVQPFFCSRLHPIPTCRDVVDHGMAAFFDPSLVVEKRVGVEMFGKHEEVSNHGCVLLTATLS